MKKIILGIELEFDEKLFYSNNEERDQFYKDFLESYELILHSNYIGDTVGAVKILKIKGEKNES